MFCNGVQTCLRCIAFGIVTFIYSSLLFAHSSADLKGEVSTNIPVITINPDQHVNPWTHLLFNNKPENFQFALVGDRTGGMRPGVFADAVKKINLLQPEFVLSVGDLIEGYTEDRQQVVAEWNEFDVLVQQLEMPFFYVAGNHDITNKMMADVWLERYGKMHYEFVYRDVLFIVLNSMDGKKHHISKEQVAWLKGVLADNPNPRWTMVFVHTPLWDRSDSGLWPKIDRALKGRKFSVFAGHNHRYVKQNRKGSAYITLATTGGGSGLRGPRFGEFDHLMWVTMTDKGPILANLLLEGIWADDVRDEPIRKMQNQLIDGGKLAMLPLLLREGFEQGQTELRLTNDSNVPYNIQLVFKPFNGVSIAASSKKSDSSSVELKRHKGLLQANLTIPPNDLVRVPLSVSVDKPIDEERNLLEMDWKLSFDYQERSVEYEAAERLNLVKEFPIVKADRLSLDGDLKDWSNIQFLPDAGYAYFEKRNWHSREDASFEWAIAETEKDLFIAIKVNDDSIVYDKKAKDWWRRDMFRVQLDARPLRQRLFSRAKPRKGKGYYLIALSAPSKENTTHFIKSHNKVPKGMNYKARRVAGGYVYELAIPWRTLRNDAGGEPDGVRVNVFQTDEDVDELGSAGLEWQPSWDYRRATPGAGNFYRQ